MNLFSLIKAAFSQDMNLFRYKSKNRGKNNKMLLPIMLFGVVCFSIGSYEYAIAEVLKPYDFTYVMLTMVIVVTTIIAFVEGIYKAQGILFDAKDNDLLFSLPIKKSRILFIRILKILVFQYLFSLMFLLPAFVVYSMFEAPQIVFYLISFLMTFLVPIIPTVIACVLGYVIRFISSKAKKQKIIQSILTFIMFLGVFGLAFYFRNFMDTIGQNAQSINNMLNDIYYPSKLYLNLINNFNILDLIQLLLMNIVPIFLFILIGAKFYFKIIAKSKEHESGKNRKLKDGKIKVNTQLISLVKKELKRYFSCTTYIFNTSIGLLLGVIVTIILCVNGDGLINSLYENMEIQIDGISLEVLFYSILLFIGLTTSISSSSISLEGKTINITKSLPIKESLILKSKILTCFVIELPFLLIADLIYIIRFTPNVIYTILFFMASFFVILIPACFGLLVNLKYPKMDASSDTEVVKQSMSSMICSFSGFGSLMVFSGLTIGLSFVTKPLIALIVTQTALFIIATALYVILMKTGPKKYNSINV